MVDRIHQFFQEIKQNPIELYSEFGLQHELALYLRLTYNDINVRLEIPTPRIFNSQLPRLIKKEIDIFIETHSGLKYVIELKMPKDDCGTPNEMYRAIQDIKFLEQLKKNGINGCYSILMTERQAFWNAPQANAGIYQLFNGIEVNIKSIDNDQLPNFLHKKGQILLANIHKANWNDYVDRNNNNWKYYIVEI